MPLSDDHIKAFARLLHLLSNFKNRNSRLVGPQFVHLPDRAQYPDYYEKIQRPRSLDMVKRGIDNNLYNNASQLYFDIIMTFKAIEETVNRSSVTWRDATKMQTILEEYWKEDARLPPLETIDPIVRLGGTEDAGEEGSDKPHRGPYRPDLTPELNTDGIHQGFVATGVANYTGTSANTPVKVKASPSPAPTPSIAQPPIPLPVPAPQPIPQIPPPAAPAGLTPMQILSPALHRPSAPQPSVPTPSVPIISPGIPSTEHIYELPLHVPPGIVSKEARRKLQKRQDEIFAARARQLLPKKRKRRADEMPDPSTGWLEPRSDPNVQKQVFTELITRLRAEKEPKSGRGLAAAINALPSMDKFPQFYSTIKDPSPPTLQSVEKHLRTNAVPDSSDFDAELMTIFSNARIWPATGLNSSDSEALPAFYGDVISLQRVYQDLTRGTGVFPRQSVPPARLASVPYGPGSIPLKQYETEDGEPRLKVLMSRNRLPTEEKVYLESVNFKGEELRAGDFVHLYNPSNPKLPIIGQVFGCYRKANGFDRFLSVNWYYRPSQTCHTAERTFYEQEVFKTSLFIDHILEDFIERASVMPIDLYLKGRWDSWHEDMPTYVVEHRYNIESRSFSKIQKWHHCVPEDTIPDPIFFRAFIDYIPPHPRIKSPFIRTSTIQGPGQLADPLEREGLDQAACYTRLDGWAEGAGQVSGWNRLMLRKRLAEPILPPLIEPQEDTQAEKKPMTSMKRQRINTRLEEDKPSYAEQLASREEFELLPEDIASQFRALPETQDLLWFAAPPVSGSAEQATEARSSLDYLDFLAVKMGY